MPAGRANNRSFLVHNNYGVTARNSHISVIGYVGIPRPNYERPRNRLTQNFDTGDYVGDKL